MHDLRPSPNINSDSNIEKHRERNKDRKSAKSQHLKASQNTAFYKEKLAIRFGQAISQPNVHFSSHVTHRQKSSARRILNWAFHRTGQGYKQT